MSLSVDYFCVTTALHFLVVTFTVCVVYIECILYILYLLFTIVIFGGLWEAKNDNNKIGVWVLLLWFVTFWSSVLIERRKLGHWHFFFSKPRHDCISEFSKIKKEIPEKFIKVLKGETTIVPERRVTLNINDKLHLIFFNFVQICVQSILPPYCSSHFRFPELLLFSIYQVI
jgi:hypothetical protein